MQLFLIFSLLALTGGIMFTASRLSDLEVQPIKVKNNERNN